MGISASTDTDYEVFRDKWLGVPPNNI